MVGSHAVLHHQVKKLVRVFVEHRTLLLVPIPKGTTPSFMLRWLCETARLEASAFGRFVFSPGQVAVQVAADISAKVSERVSGALLAGVRIACRAMAEGDQPDAARFTMLKECLDWEGEEEARRGSMGASREGDALNRLRIVDETPGLWGRTLLTLGTERGADLPWSRLDPGLPVLVATIVQGDGETPARGVVVSRSASRLVVALDDDPPDDGSLVRVSKAPDEVSRKRQQGALERVASAFDDRLACLRDIAAGLMEAESAEWLPSEWVNSGLNDSQKEAIVMAMSARDIALIHGPPGTGKTTTLLEVVLQAVRRGQHVLVTAPSNLAVDHLLEGLVRHGLRAVRLGHPARIHEDLRSVSLDALVDKHPDTRESRRITKQARALFRKAGKWTRGKPEPGERQADRVAAKQLFADARALDDQVVAAILRDAQVVAATATGLDAGVLMGRRFDLVVLDEAGQATEPVAWSALLHADRAILAGDPCQLPPTVVSDRARKAGFEVSLLERLLAMPESVPSVLLNTQYRMSEALALFPSVESYGGRLLSHVDNADIRLSGSEWSEPPFLFIDTAGAGWEERQEEGNGVSRWNPAEADYLVRLTHRLVEEGILEADIGLITPYAAQARLLRERLGRAGVEIDSVDGFQGREKDVILVSLVRSNDAAEIGFLAETRRTHVAITRARKLLVLVGDSVTLGSHPWYQRLIDRAAEMVGHRSVYEDPIGIDLV